MVLKLKTRKRTLHRITRIGKSVDNAFASSERYSSITSNPRVLLLFTLDFWFSFWHLSVSHLVFTELVQPLSAEERFKRCHLCILPELPYSSSQKKKLPNHFTQILKKEKMLKEVTLPFQDPRANESGWGHGTARKEKSSINIQSWVSLGRGLAI